MNARKTIRILAASFTALALLTFSTVVVSDFDCHNPADDARCPYCHLTHQAPPEPGIAQVASTLSPVAFLALPQDVIPDIGPIFCQTAPRAPPV